MPEIIIDRPTEGVPVQTPVDIKVRFASTGAPIDPETLKVEAKVALFWVNITDRVVEGATVTAEGVEANGVDIPTGEHKVRMTIKDTAGARAQKTVSFTVV